MSERKSIRVLLVDDHTVVRKGLCAFLMAFDDMELVGEAANGEKAIYLCEKTQPDVVLMDLIMPEMDGIAAARAIRDRCPATEILALTSFKEEDLVKGVLEAGAIGYLLKDVSADELASAIRAAHAGQPTLAPEAVQVLIQAVRKPKDPGGDLTERERGVLALMVNGSSNNKIAEALVISPTTVKFHIGKILSKLKVNSRTEAVALALKHNLIG